MKKKILPMALSFGLILSLISNTPSMVNAANNDLNKSEQILQNMNELSNNKLNSNIELSKGKVFISGNLSAGKLNSDKDALNFMEENKSLFGLDKISDKFKVTKTTKDALGYTHVQMSQYIDGLPVKDKQITLHYNNNGIAINITGEVENTINTITSLGNKALSEKEAIEIAKKEFTYTQLAYEPKVQALAYIKDGKAYKVYNVNIKFNEPKIGNYDVLVEASSGTILDKLDNIRYDGAIIGSGTAVDGFTKTLNLYQSGSTYQMKDTTKAMTGQILTYTANTKLVEPGTLLTNITSNFNTETLKAGVSAHYFAGVVYDFYKNLFNRNSIDNAGMTITSTVHYDSKYNNAFWDGAQMVYGDGDGTLFTYLSGDLDVVGHEMTHGVTERTANLVYKNQSGALNESMSDVLIETYDKYNVKFGGSWTFNSSDWVVGDAVYTPKIAGDALRSLATPTLYSQPDNMSKYVNTTSDNGGVHTNSGITNKAAYLIAQALGCAKTSQIYYRALTNYMISTTDFLGARNALIQSATDLYGVSSAEVIAVGNAFTSVGIVASTSTDTYEPNGTTAQAYSITKNTIYNSFIFNATDVDYYKFTQSATGTINISLTNLPKDYDLYLYKSSGTLVASSAKGSTTSESIIYNATTTGTYYVKVIGYNGVYSTSTKYALKVY
ncbi:MAG: M4 family metallopeptidase [Clostridiaceae bacterium]|nr:M4 family metallopeptidase [Clostridiaceae bacterium]